jgi:hypothetical protein
MTTDNIAESAPVPEGWEVTDRITFENGDFVEFIDRVEDNHLHEGPEE